MNNWLQGFLWGIGGGIFAGFVVGYFMAALMFISRDRERKRRRRFLMRKITNNQPQIAQIPMA